MRHNEVYEYINDNKKSLSIRIMAKQYEGENQSLMNIPERIKEKYIQDSEYNLTFLANAIKLHNKQLYFDYMKWLGKLMNEIGLSKETIVSHFISTEMLIQEELGTYKGAIVKSYIDEGINYFVKSYDETNEDYELYESRKTDEDIFLKYLLNFQKEEAKKYIMDKLEKGEDIKEIYLNILQPTLYEIGELWQRQEITVAKEHYCTAVIQSIIASIYPYLFKNTVKKNRSLVAVCAGPELHEIGMRMVADFFEMDGWDTLYLGANLPIESIIKELKKASPNMIAISTTTSINIQYTMDLIETIRKAPKFNSLKIIVGGKIFNEVTNLWVNMGADGYAKDPLAAIDIANRIVGENNENG